MEQIKELTKRLIANSFKELMLQNSFDKITIKMITDHANVIRPTFYNHFHDKYELVEWIVVDEILSRSEGLLDSGDSEGGIKAIFEGFLADREYYRRAFDIEGQNGFAETLSKLLTDIFVRAFEHEAGDVVDVDANIVSKYYASGMITILRYGLFEAGECSTEDILKVHDYLMKHTIYDII